MPTFLGIDLAWKSKNPSGICVLRRDGHRTTCVRLECGVRTTQELADLAESYGDDVVVAIDAPLIISDQRRAEREVHRLFSPFKAPAYPANPGRLEREGMMAGPNLCEELRRRGFDPDPAGVRPGCFGRHVIEVYPHTLHVVWFRLDERIAYKVKSGRTPANLVVALQIYQEKLGVAVRRWMPGLLEECGELRALLDPPAARARGRARKDLEDQLDALTCALAAYGAWRDGVDDSEVLGNAQHGYIAVPGLRLDQRFVGVPAR